METKTTNPYLTAGLTLKQSNIITSSRFEYTARELDFLVVLLVEMTKQGFRGTKFYITEKDLGWLTQGNTKLLLNIVSGLASRIVVLPVVHSETGVPYTTIVGLITKVNIFFDQLEVHISEELMPHYQDLTKYTSMELRTSLSVTSKYTKRLYQLLCQYRYAPTPTNKTNPTWNVSVYDLKCLLGIIPPDHPAAKKQVEADEKEASSPYASFGEFKRSVLELVRRELDNEAFDLSFTYQKTAGKGKTTTHLLFNIFNRKKELVLSPEQVAAKAWLVQYGLKEAAAVKVLEVIPVDALRLDCNHLLKMFTNIHKPVNNTGGYLARYFTEKYNIPLAKPKTLEAHQPNLI